MRCAIYTRKSSEEGLEQAFNSLDAQREACAAFILSQKHEGWTVSPTLYDDGGFSGGTMDRPALQRLLGDIGAGKVDVVVVYKIGHLQKPWSNRRRADSLRKVEDGGLEWVGNRAFLISTNGCESSRRRATISIG
jgi:DNA invertase Pin-like site-specific DNA recombinase